MAKDVRGITWVGNIYQKFENMCLEVEDIIVEDAAKYVEHQMQTVGESFKKLYSDVMLDLLPSSCDLDEKIASELPIHQNTDAEFRKNKLQGSEKITVKVDIKQTNEDSRINHDTDDDVTCAASCDTDTVLMLSSGHSIKGNDCISRARQYVGSTDVTSNPGRDESQQNKEMLASSEVDELTLLQTDMCRTSQSCELSNESENYAVTISKQDSDEVTRLASVAGWCNEIEIASDEQISNVQILVKSAEEKEMNTSSSSSVLFGDRDETWCMDETKIVLDNEQQYNEQKLEESCVMVTRDELQLVPKAGANLKPNKKKTRQPFSLSKKSARMQEYEELAILHGKNEQGKGDYCMENLCPASMEDQKKLQLPDISEAEWELL